jgi:hypothetical protein
VADAKAGSAETPPPVTTAREPGKRRRSRAEKGKEAVR